MTTIGRVDLLVDFDGKTLPAQARAIGTELGTEAGNSFNDRFASRFSKLTQGLLPEMDRQGRLGGNRLANAFANAVDNRLQGIADDVARAFLTPSSLDDFARDFETTDLAAASLRDKLTELRDAGDFTDHTFARFNGTLGQWQGRARGVETVIDDVGDAFGDVEVGIEDVTEALDKQTASTNKSSAGWKGLSTNFKQVVLAIAAIASSGSEIATLGSAAGAGLVILGTAAVTAGTGIGVLIAGLQNITTSDLTELPEQARDAAAAFQTLTAAFTPLQQAIQASLLDGLGPAIQNITDVLLPTLTSGLTGVASALDSSLGAAIARLTSPEAQATLGGIFAGIQAQIPGLVDSIGNIVSILGTVILAAEPFTTQFIGWIDEITTKLDAFFKSPEGQNDLNEFFTNGVTILSKFADLIGAAGTLLGDLVTPKSVEQTGAFLDHLTGAIPFIEQLLSSLSNLDVFGLLAQILDDVGNGLGTILHDLDPLFTLINELLQPAIAALGVAFQIIGVLLIPFRIGLEIITALIKPFTDYLTQMTEAFTPVFDAVQAVADQFLTALQPALTSITDKITALLPSPAQLADIIQNQVVPAIKNFGDWIANTLVPATEQIIKKLPEVITQVLATATALKDFLVGVEKFAADFVAAFLGPITAIQGLIGWINTLNGTTATVHINGPTNATGHVAFASGGIANSATFGVFGEDGPEAFVPLNRPLSQVDPAVRALSAIAQGKAVPPSDSSRPGLTVAPGAIVIQGVTDGEQAANAALDRVVARFGG